ncbi:MAG: hypothetical protein U1E24_02725 [Phenylobacterium sp.]|nr:hypothetical protein [Phenylobacterium sp.]
MAEVLEPMTSSWPAPPSPNIRVCYLSSFPDLRRRHLLTSDLPGVLDPGQGEGATFYLSLARQERAHDDHPN